MPLPYRSVKDIYDPLVKAGVVTAPLPQWSEEMNALTGSDLYSSGLHDNLVKRGSIGLDRLLEATGLPELSGYFGQQVGEAVGAPEAGQSIGHGLPRSAVNFAPMLFGPWGRVGTGVLSGAQTYTETGSPAAGVLSGVTNALMPGVAGAAEQFFLKKAGGQLLEGPIADVLGKAGVQGVSQFSRRFPTTIVQGIGAELAGQGAAALFGEASGFGQDLLTGQPLHNPFSVETLLNMTLGQAPFAALYLTKGGRAKFGGDATRSEVADISDRIAKTQEAIAFQKAQTDAKVENPLGSIADFTTTTANPKATAENAFLLDQLRGRKVELQKEATPQSAEEWNKISEDEQRIVDEQRKITGGKGTVGGSAITPQSERFNVVGKTVFRREADPERGYPGFRIVEIVDDPANIEAGLTPGHVVKYSTLHEPVPSADPLKNGEVYSVPRSHSTVAEDPYKKQLAEIQASRAAANPELPQQDKPLEVDHYRAQIDQLNKLSKQLDAVTSEGDLQKSLVDYNNLANEMGFPTLDDASIEAYRSTFGMDSVDQVVKAKTNAFMKRIERREAARKADQESADTLMAQLLAPREEALKTGEVLQSDAVALANDLNTVRTSSGIDADRFNRLALEWDKNGRQGGIQGLIDKVNNAKKSGKGKQKTKSVVDKVEELPPNDPVVEPVTYQRVDIADVIATKVAREDPNLAADAANWFDWVEGGAKKLPATLENKEHVEDWNDQLRQYMQRLVEKSSISRSLDSVPPESDHLPAGSHYVFSLAPYDEVTGMLGTKHRLGKDPVVRVAAFRNMAGRDGRPLPAVEIELYKAIVPEAFDENGNVKVKELYKGLKEKGPVVEVKKLGDANATRSPARIEFDSMIHEWFDNLPQDVRTKVSNASAFFKSGDQQAFELRLNSIPEQFRDQARKFAELEKTTAEEPLPVGSRYSFLGPKAEQEMPGYVEGLVRVPEHAEQNFATQVEAEKFAGGINGVSQNQNGTFRARKSEVKFPGPHFGSEDTNVLAFFRGYEETLPDGRKAFHVIEVQSDWGQAVRKNKEATPEQRAAARDAGIEDAEMGDSSSHPLLASYETLALKAAIDHARSVGAEAIILSDGETAMMTEGHDKAMVRANDAPATIPYNEAKAKLESAGFQVSEQGRVSRGNQSHGYLIKEGDTSYLENGTQQADDILRTGKVQEPSQSAGMRLHYDTTLPSTMKKLTGSEGERVEVGQHKGAIEWEGLDQKISGSPVFRNPDGTPKSSISGRLYPLDKAFSTADTQGGRFTLSEPSRALDEFAETAKPFVPQTTKEKVALREWGIERGGAGVLDRVTRSIYPENAALAKALQQFPALVSKIKVEFWDMPGTSFVSIVDGIPTVVLDSALLHEDGDFAERQALHEVLHGMTKAELHNPTNAEAVNKLTALREQMVERLSTKGGDASDRAAFDRAVESNWMKRWNAGTASQEELHANPKTRRVLYALLNNDELISMGFTSDDVRSWLQSQKTPRTKTLWNTFAGWVKELLHLGEPAIGDTAFNDLMNHTQQIMNNAEFVTSARDYFTRFYENKGLDAALVQEQTQRALGAVLDSKASPDMLLDNLFWKNGGELNPQLRQRSSDAMKMFQLRPEEGELANQVGAELGLSQTELPGLQELAQGIAQGDHANVEDILESLPDTASRFVFAALRDVKEVLDGVQGIVSKQNVGLTNLADTSMLRSSVGEAQRRLASALKIEAQHVQAQQDILGMSTINPQGLREVTTNPSKSRSLDDIKAMVDPDAPKQEFLTWIERTLALPYQIARMDPRAAELVARVEQQVANAHKMKSESLKIFATDQIANTLKQAADLGINLLPGQVGGEFTKDSLKRTLEVFQKPKLTKVINEWIFENQKRNPGAEVVLPDSDPKIRDILQGLTSEEKATVNEAMHKISVSKTAHDSQIVEKMTQVSSTAANKVLGRAAREFGLNLSLNERMSLTSTLLQASLADFNDPQSAAGANAQIQQVASKLPVEVFNQLLKFTNAEATKIKLIRDNMAQRPGWVSGQDYGRYRIVWLDDKQQPHRWSGNDEKEARAVAKKASKVVEFKDRKSSDDEIHYPSITPELIARIRELEKTSWDIQGLSPEERQVARQSSISGQVEREAGAQGVSGVVSPTRRLSRGAGDIPWAENHFSWVTSSANSWTRQLLRTQYDAHVAEPEVQASDQYKTWAKDYFEGYMRQDPEAATKMRKFTSIWFLGGNLASAIANPIGNAMRTVSELTAMSGKPVNSYSRYLKAAQEVAGNFKHFAGTSAAEPKWATPEHEQLMKDAASERKIAPTLYDENAAADEAVSTSFKQAIEGQKPQTWAKRLGTMAGSFTTAAMWPFRMGEIWNSQVAILSAFDFYREQGLDYNAAKAKAFEFNGSVNDSGGRANRPVGPFSARGEVPRSAAMLGTSMQSFVLGSTFQLIRYLKAGAFRPSGLTPHEVYSARIAATQMLAMQFAAAGVLGLPFVSGALALLDKAFPELELNRKIRQGSKDFFDSDAAGGNILSDMAMTGLPSMFGWDFQSRLSMGNTLPGVSEVNGFQPETLLGPPVNLVSQFVRGGVRLVSGQGRLADWTPPAVRKMVDLVASNGSAVDYKGRPVLNDLTPGEKLGMGLGFQPKRLSDFNAASRIASNVDRVAATREAQFRQGLAEEVAAGNFGNVRQELLQRSQADKTFDPVAAVRGIAKATEELSFPRDLRREGTSGTNGVRSQLLSAFRIDPQNPSELQRLQLRKQVEQRLGLPTQLSKAEVEMASLMDQLKAKSPSATRSEIRRSAEVALRRSGRLSLQEQPE